MQKPNQNLSLPLSLSPSTIRQIPTNSISLSFHLLPRTQMEETLIQQTILPNNQFQTSSHPALNNIETQSV